MFKVKPKILIFTDFVLFSIASFNLFMNVFEFNLFEYNFFKIIIITCCALIVGSVKFFFVLKNFNQKNIYRLLNFKKTDLWNLFTLRDFLIIVFMIIIGKSLSLFFNFSDVFYNILYIA